MNYKEARAYLEEVNARGSALGLDNIIRLLQRLGNPQQALNVVHVAGTNGKGSTMTFLQSILMQAGYRVGRYSSPAVFEALEIIRINDDFIEEEVFARLLTHIRKTCEEMVQDGYAHPTSFEMETALALLYFKEQACDIVLIECGMGGEGDATNVFGRVLCSVITTISLDHMQFLGETIAEIATVKSGIIKEHCPVVMARQTKEAMETITQIAEQKQARLIVTGSAQPQKTLQNTEIQQADMPEMDDDIARHNPVGVMQHFIYQASNGKTYRADLQMLGTYQMHNAATAVEAALVLGAQGFDVEPAMEKGLQQAVWPGRMEIISTQPLIVIDGAHNPGAVAELKQTIDLYFTNKRITFIMGVLADKDFVREAEMIAEKSVHIITVTPDNPRALSGETLAETLRRYNQKVQVADTIETALQWAKQTVSDGKADMILAFGSLSYLGALKSAVREVREE